MRLFLLLSFSTLMLLEGYMFTYETDKQTLLEFKSQVSESKRAVLSSWNNSFPLCKWTWVKCGKKHKRVTGLNLGGLQLGGVISPSIGNLSFLISLNLTSNGFGGTIPQELGSLFRLKHLFMSFNFLKGEIPTKLGSLRKLVLLDLGRNNLKGKFPASLGNLTSLQELSFVGNIMEGEIPNDLARLANMVDLQLAANNFSGVFPQAIYNMSLLENLNIIDNGFSGSLRSDIGNLLPHLQGLFIGNNSFSGAIPATLPNISNLQNLGMEINSLTGSIPPSFGKLRDLQLLSLHTNSFGSHSFQDLEFFGALSNCTQLSALLVAYNRLAGDLSTSIANLSTNINILELQSNFISGSIPHDNGNLINLKILSLGNNLLTGALPTSLGKLSGLEEFSVGSNKMSGEIPSSLGNITRLESLWLFNNSFEGSIPPSIGKSVGRLEHLGTLSVAHNRLSGKLPETLGKCLLMVQLDLQGNSFDGTIPDISGLLGIKEVDFSNNNLSGSIPGYFANFSSLEHLNLSINNFEGKVPTEGKFKNATIVSVFGNINLCGGVLELKLKPCKHASFSKKVLIGISIGVSALLVLFIAFVSLCWFRNKRRNKTNEATPSTLGTFHEQISYGDLRNATNGFSSSNLVGSGCFGTVFKALIPPENKVVAVKVLNLQQLGALKSFMAECESLKNVRHRNLVKLLTACSSIDFQGNQFRALIYEFMPNGSLDMWLHPDEVEEIRRPSRTLTLLERLNISIDVAYVLDYLHVHSHEAIAHCDLKPSNVLLDEDLTAHVSDFGLARILLKFDQEYFLNQLSSAGVRGTIGYAAPEYGMGGQVSTHGDMYSFGILLLEMFSGKRPTNELFGGNFTLHSYIESALPGRVLDVADEVVLHNGLRIGFPVADCLKLVFEVGLRCCEEYPVNRLAMGEALKELITIRERFFRSRRRARH
ncbi:hypothetical protein Bca4012_051627 [Brassica carinata]